MSDEFLNVLRQRVGTPVLSDWVTVSQAMIDKFADATGDDQFIHVDPEAASRTPFGGTIAHGFLTLSLFPRLASTAPGVLPEGPVRMSVNYGGDRIRFLSPVRSGSRVRGRFVVLDVTEKRPGHYQQTTDFVVEIEGQEKPALAGQWIVQLWT